MTDPLHTQTTTAFTPLAGRMGPRDPDASHRAATPLELFFDLVFVVAIAQAASGLHHAVAGNHVADGVGSYLMVFFAIWWAWMNFTWFASAYDSDDALYRVTVFVELTGALILAAGVSEAFETLDFTTVTIGYTVMRVGIIANWIRAGLGDRLRRTTAMRYAGGLVVVQSLWIALLWAPALLSLPGFFALVAVELAIPVWAERAEPTPWHRHHITERYGLLTIIVLGESVLAATLSIETALSEGEGLSTLLPTIGGGLLMLYSMWWLYFDRPVHHLLTDVRRAFAWGYGHYLVYASAAAVGAGLAVNTDFVTDHAEISEAVAGASVAVPAAVYVLVLWVLHHRPREDAVGPRWLAPVAILALLATPWTPQPVLACGLVLTGLPVVKLLIRHRHMLRLEAGP